jgi:hypothetical protein
MNWRYLFEPLMSLAKFFCILAATGMIFPYMLSSVAKLKAEFDSPFDLLLGSILLTSSAFAMVAGYYTLYDLSELVEPFYFLSPIHTFMTRNVTEHNNDTLIR